MADDFDLDNAERVLMTAQAATGHMRAAERLSMFPEVVDTLGSSVREVKRLRITRATAIEEAREDMRQVIAEEIRAAIEHYGRVMPALEALHAKVTMKQRADGKFRWWPDSEFEFSEAYDKLRAAHLQVKLGQ